ncbi:MAG TPA: hypothetical protein DCE78_06190 [Bacteroidetes bacterium]|nr:hypothetical protein [Bacteroidota bacterium]
MRSLLTDIESEASETKPSELKTVHKHEVRSLATNGRPNTSAFKARSLWAYIMERSGVKIMRQRRMKRGRGLIKELLKASGQD